MDYEVSLQTISWIQERRDTDSLEISPKFQRRAVWLERERSSLIETICLNLPFPEVYIQIVTNQETGKQRYIVVDGQQRITTILKFVDGEVQLPLDSTWKGKGFSELTPDEKNSFWNYKVVVRSLRNTSDPEIRDLFERLNTNNIVLNDQELRNARYSGRFKDVSESLADDPFFQKLGLFTAKNVRRMEDVEYVSELLLLLVAGVQNKKDLLEDFYSAYNDEFPEESQYILEFKTALLLIQQITTMENKAFIKTRSNFYSIFGACAQYYRDTDRSNFKKPDQIAVEITSLLQSVKTFDSQGKSDNLIVQEYYDAVSRAASDKSRRALREKILYDIIESIENR